MSGSKRRASESDSSSDSDDDIPLSKLRADARAGIDITVKAEPHAVVTPDVAIKKDDPAPEVSVKRESNGESARKKAAVESDSDDDMPISGLRKKIKVEVKRESAAAPSAASRSTSSYNARTPTRTKKRVIKIKYKQQECTEELYQTLKGRLTQELLCRWWYAIKWPPVKAKETRLHGVQELDGFRGAYIRVKGDEMGSIVDTRTPVGKPSFLHFFAMPSAEIQKLLVKAYEKQMQVLIEHEVRAIFNTLHASIGFLTHGTSSALIVQGEDAPLLKELRSAKASAERISPEKADRSVVKVLKGYKELAEQLKEIEERAMKEENTATEEDEDDDGDDDDDDE